MDDRIILHLIRHEKTQANVERKYIGWTDEPIVTEGYTPQIHMKPAIVYGSDLVRCKQTAALYFPQAQFKENAQLREIHFGDFEMKTYDELKNLVEYRAWIDCPGNNTPPNGEAFTHFEERVLRAFREIMCVPGTKFFIVHGGVIRVLLAHFGLEQQDFQQVMAQHRMIYTLEWENLTQLQGGARCKLYSEAHITEKGST